jgi:hypothetical protein
MILFNDRENFSSCQQDLIIFKQNLKQNTHFCFVQNHHFLIKYINLFEIKYVLMKY